MALERTYSLVTCSGLRTPEAVISGKGSGPVPATHRLLGHELPMLNRAARPHAGSGPTIVRDAALGAESGPAQHRSATPREQLGGVQRVVERHDETRGKVRGMWLRIWTIAMNAYREAVRARVLLGLAGVAFAVSVFSLVIGSFTLDNAPRVVADLGAATISLFSIAVSIVIGATSLYRELEQKTIFPILARPISRGEYVIGKFGGTLLTVGVFIAADTGLVLSLLSLLGGRNPLLVLGLAAGLLTMFGLVAWRVPWARTFGPIPFAVALLILGALMADVAPNERRLVLTASFLSLLEVSIITACATMLSSFSSPFLSALLTVGVWIIGRNTDSFDRFSKKAFGAFISSAARGLGKVWPNLQVYVPRRPFLTGEALDIDRTQYLLMASGLSLAWTLGFLTLAIIVFRRRDFL